MIQNLRQHADSWYVKGFLAIVVFGFVFLGVGDLIRLMVYDKPIAYVGSESISMEELDRTIRTELKRIQLAQKVQVNLSDLEQYGFIEKMLERLVAQHLLTQELDRLGIVASENSIRSNIQNLQPFLKDGVFDPSQFETFLKNTGLTEQGLVRDMRKQIMDQQYFLSFSLAAALPDFYKDVLLKAMLQKRVFATISIDASKIALTEKIQDADVQAFYDENKDHYKKPESRDIQVLVLDVSKLAQKVSVSDEDLSDAYDNRKDLYSTPEKRTFKKVVVSSEKDAQNVQKMLKEKKSTDAVLESVKGSKIIDLKSVAMDQIKEHDAQALFALKEKEASEVYPEEMGFAVYFVEKKTAAAQKALNDVKAEILKDIQIERFQDDYKKIKNNIEDDLAGGAKIVDLAKEYNAELVSVSGLTADGKALMNKSFKGFEKDVLDQAMQLGDNNASNVMDVTSDKSVVVIVEKITPENVPAFDAVKKDVVADLTTYKKRIQASKIAQDIANGAKNVGQMAELASKNSVSLKTNISFSRMSMADDKSLQENGAIMIYDRAFSLPLGKAIAGPVKDGFLVVMPEKEIETGKFDEAKKEELIKRFDSLMHESMANLLVESLKKRYKVDIRADRLEAYKKMINKDS